MEKKISEQIKGFLDFVDECREPNSMAYDGIRQRRVYKDMYGVTFPVIEFAQESHNQKALDSARQLLGRICNVEKYHENRVYIPRVKEGGLMWIKGF